MATLADTIYRTRRILHTGSTDERNKLAANILTNATSLTCTYPLSQIKRGTRLSINLEDIYVWGTSSLTVSPIDRGQFGTVPAAHTAGDTIHVDPKFSNWDVYNCIAEELNSLGANGLYQLTTVELTYNPVISAYDFPTSSVLEIYEVRYSTPGPSREYPQSNDWELLRAMSDEFTGSTAIVVRDAFPGSTVLVSGKYGYTPIVPAMTTDLVTTGLQMSAYDILSIGAAWRLTAPREVRRNFDEVQGDTRRADEVPPGANIAASRELLRMRDIRIKEEVTRLAQQFPRTLPRYPYRASYS